MKVLSLTEIKDLLSVVEFDVVDSKIGKRGTVYAGQDKIGLVKEGLTAKDLIEKRDQVVAVYHEETSQWIFTHRSSVKL